jgi:hypothetical protein
VQEGTSLLRHLETMLAPLRGHVAKLVGDCHLRGNVPRRDLGNESDYSLHSVKISSEIVKGRLG